MRLGLTRLMPATRLEFGVLGGVALEALGYLGLGLFDLKKLCRVFLWALRLRLLYDKHFMEIRGGPVKWRIVL